MNKEGDTNVNVKGLSDIEEYNSDDLLEEYYREDESSAKEYFQIFKLPKRMRGYKWKMGDILRYKIGN